MEVARKRRRVSASAAAAVSEPSPQQRQTPSADQQAFPASSAEVEGKKPARPADIPIARGNAIVDVTAKCVSPSPTGGSGKKKRRRRKRKAGEHHQGSRNNNDGGAGGGGGSSKWKPYDKLTWEERRVLDEKETRRATTRRDARIASGQPMAPYNTTQFLMDQHDPAFDPSASATTLITDAAVPRKRNAHRKSSGSLSEEIDEDTSDDDLNSDRVGYDGTTSGGGGNDEEIFLEKDFADAYESFRAERLQTLSKDELVREYLEMEAKLEGVYTRLGGLQGGGSGAAAKENICTGHDPVISLSDELQRLRAENVRLAAENEQLRKAAH